MSVVKRRHHLLIFCGLFHFELNGQLGQHKKKKKIDMIIRPPGRDYRNSLDLIISNRRRGAGLKALLLGKAMLNENKIIVSKVKIYTNRI